MARLEGSLDVTGYVDAAEYRGLSAESTLVGDGAARRFRVRHRSMGGFILFLFVALRRFIRFVSDGFIKN